MSTPDLPSLPPAHAEADNVRAPELRSGAGLGVSVCDGKYTIQADGDGRLRALRYGEPWRDLTGDGMVLALVQEIQRLREDALEARQMIKDGELCGAGSLLWDMSQNPRRA